MAGEYCQVTRGLLWTHKALSGNKQILSREFCVVAGEFSDLRCQIKTLALKTFFCSSERLREIYILLDKSSFFFLFLQSQRRINSYVCWPLKSCHMISGIDFDEGGILNTQEKPSVQVGMRPDHIQKSKSA